MRRILIITVLVACAAGLGRAAPSANSRASTLSGTVTYVVDGDTVHVDLRGRNERVRLTLGLRPRGVGLKTRDPGKKVKATVFVRDSFTCCYCDRRTIPPDILKLLSHRFGDDFGYQKSWKPPTHRAYWDISTSLDHVIAVSVGGDWKSVSNLATTCYRCQEQKSNRALNTVARRKRAKSTWDGLTKSYEQLWLAVQPPGGDHRAWIAAFGEAWERREADHSFEPTPTPRAAAARSRRQIKQTSR
jgi:5-methylcytosine-specific restriction endonuclease McrA